MEITLNGRPLRYVYEEGVSEEPQNPAHLRYGRQLTLLPPYPSVEEDEEDSSKGLNKRMRYLSFKVDHFWKRWRNGYFSELRKHHKRNVKKGGAIFEIGDIVKVVEEGVSRGKWKQGKVEKGKANVPQQTTEDIVPLEVREAVQTRQTVTEPVGEEQVKTPKAPRRAAAMDTDFRR